MSLTRSLSLAVVLGTLWASPAQLAGQDRSSSRVVWDAGTLGSGWCIHFLVEPKDAEDDMAKGLVPVIARNAAGLPAPIQRLIAAEPEYGEWVPSMLCTYTSATLTANRRRFDRGDGGQPMAFAFWGVAASGEGFPSDSGGMSFRKFGSNSSGLLRVMETNSFPMEKIPISVKPIPGGEDQQFQIKLEGATIIFDGHPRADSTLVPGPVRQTGRYRGHNLTLWDIEVSFAPTDVASLSGALRVQGKKGLAGVLNRSPIRLLGTVVSGGDGEVLFNH